MLIFFLAQNICNVGTLIRYSWAGHPACSDPVVALWRWVCGLNHMMFCSIVETNFEATRVWWYIQGVNMSVTWQVPLIKPPLHSKLHWPEFDRIQYREVSIVRRILKDTAGPTAVHRQARAAQQSCCPSPLNFHFFCSFTTLFIVKYGRHRVVPASTCCGLSQHFFTVCWRWRDLLGRSEPAGVRRGERHWISEKSFVWWQEKRLVSWDGRNFSLVGAVPAQWSCFWASVLNGCMWMRQCCLLGIQTFLNWQQEVTICCVMTSSKFRLVYF